MSLLPPPPLPDLNNHQVWTFHNRVALVVAVTEAGSPLADQAKLSTLSTTLYEMLGAGDAVVAHEMVSAQRSASHIGAVVTPRPALTLPCVHPCVCFRHT